MAKVCAFKISNHIKSKSFKHLHLQHLADDLIQSDLWKCFVVSMKNISSYIRVSEYHQAETVSQLVKKKFCLN